MCPWLQYQVADAHHQQGCYANAVSLSGCSQQDLACQCRATNFAGIGIAGGPCFLAQCSLADLSILSSALTAACFETPPSTQSTAAATAATLVSPSLSPTMSTFSTSSTSSDASLAPTSTARRVSAATPSGEVIAAVPSPSEAEAQAVPANGMMAAPSGSGKDDGQNLNAAAITGIVVSGGAVGLIGGILLYFFTVVRRRKMDQAQWDSLEREKAAMQKSLEELKMAVQRAGTFDSLDEKGDSGGKKRPKTINLTPSKGPGELGVPSRIFELPASPAKLEKI
jgi:hypothetical protein